MTSAAINRVMTRRFIDLGSANNADGVTPVYNGCTARSETNNSVLCVIPGSRMSIWQGSLKPRMLDD
jgi:hypothetical protein